MSASTVSGSKLLRKSLIIFLLVLKADSEATEDAGMANRSLAIHARVGYLTALPIHHFKMSNSEERGTGFSSKYLSSSVVFCD